MCVAPRTITRRNKIDIVPCGRCLFCLSKKRADWSFRLTQELKGSTSAAFVTMTYTDETIPSDGLSKRDVQLFFKKLRKVNSCKVRYYAVGEYGSRTHRAHYHAIVFNLDRDLDILPLWSHGHIMLGTVTPASIHYVTKYVINKIDYDKNSDQNKPFALMSRRPGIGSRYLDIMVKWHREDSRNYVVNQGFKQALPRFYRDRMWDDFERQLLSFESNRNTDRLYYDEIKRLFTVHPDPYGYYVERRQHNHDLMVKKLNEKNLF